MHPVNIKLICNNFAKWFANKHFPASHLQEFVKNVFSDNKLKSSGFWTIWLDKN